MAPNWSTWNSTVAKSQTDTLQMWLNCTRMLEYFWQSNQPETSSTESPGCVGTTPNMERCPLTYNDESTPHPPRGAVKLLDVLSKFSFTTTTGCAKSPAAIIRRKNNEDNFFVFILLVFS